MKFSIRELLLVTVIVALIAGWLIDRRQLRSRYEKDVEHAIDGTIEAEDVAVQLRVELEQLKKGQSALPNSSAPTPKLPQE